MPRTLSFVLMDTYLSMSVWRTILTKGKLALAAGSDYCKSLENRKRDAEMEDKT
ncbi:hypothetical protein BDZ97DRAFT_1802608 [Flammula alnicola]|nr:hypothetical protein BDZ97DRAFT_1802608 [Flammula alnicola]